MSTIKSTSVNSQTVKHISDLANIPVTDQEADNLAKAFNDTLDVIDQLKKVDTKGVEPTSQVTGLENRLREDVVDDQHMFTQQQALANAKDTYQGYFVVNRLIDKD